MPTLRPFALVAFLLPLLVAGPAQAADTSGPIVHHAVKGKFAYVLDDLKLAIANRGLVIDHVSHVAKMLDRTGKDMGRTKKMYGDDQGQVLSFCSATISRGTMEADVHNIVFCPYTIAVYTTLADPGTVHVAWRRPQRPDGSTASTAALRDVEKLLDGIVREALNLK